MRTAIERATGADLGMLAIGAASPVPQQFGVVLVLDTSGGFDVAAAQALLADRIRSVPRLRQRLVRVPPGCGRPIWADDPGFDARLHVHHTPCLAPGDERALLDLATAVIATPLPRSRPLWSAVLVTGLADGSAALVIVVDHVVADGIGGLAVLAALMDHHGPPLAAYGFPRPRPTVRQLMGDAVRSRWRAVRNLPGLWRGAGDAMAGVGGFRAPAAARCSLLRPTGARRRVMVVRTDLAGLRAAAHRYGGTVNDALLCSVSGALRRLLDQRGESVGTFVVTMPVAARRTADLAHLGNQIGPLVVAVQGEGEFGERVGRVAATVAAARRQAPEAPVIALFGSLFTMATRLGLYRWFMRHQRRMHTLVSNVHGPDGPLAFAGAPILSMTPIALGESGNMPVSFDALSYAGTLTISIIADPDTLPDLPELATALDQELRAVVGGAPSRSPRGA